MKLGLSSTVLVFSLFHQTAVGAEFQCRQYFPKVLIKDQKFDQFMSGLIKPTVLGLKAKTPQVQIDFENAIQKRQWDRVKEIYTEYDVELNQWETEPQIKNRRSTPFSEVLNSSSSTNFAPIFARDPRVQMTPYNIEVLKNHIERRQGKVTDAIRILLNRPDLAVNTIRDYSISRTFKAYANFDTLLTMAITLKYYDIVDILLKRPDIDVNQVLKEGKTPFQLALLTDAEMAMRLLDHPKTIVVGTLERENQIVKYNHIPFLTKTGNIDLLRKILSRKEFKSSPSENPYLKEALREMITEPKFNELVWEVIRSNPKYLNAQYPDGQTLFALAMKVQNWNLSYWMGTHEHFDVKSNFALMSSHPHLRDRAAQFARDEKFPINQVTPNGETVIIRLAQDRYGHELLKKLLDGRYDIEVNAQDKDGNTALHHAVIQKNRQAIDLLLEHPETSFFIQNKQGKDVVHTALLNEDIQTLRRAWEHPQMDQDLKEGYRTVYYNLPYRNTHRFLEQQPIHKFFVDDLQTLPQQYYPAMFRQHLEEGQWQQAFQLIAQRKIDPKDMTIRDLSISKWIVMNLTSMKTEDRTQWVRWEGFDPHAFSNPFEALLTAINLKDLELLELFFQRYHFTKEDRIAVLNQAYEKALERGNKQLATSLRKLNSKP